MSGTPIEIPQNLRDMSEQNLKQAYAVYEQITDFMTKAMNAWIGALPERCCDMSLSCAFHGEAASLMPP